jgi:hypothetical protein
MDIIIPDLLLSQKGECQQSIEQTLNEFDLCCL